jgi:uncharacterized caspase-like protein
MDEDLPILVKESSKFRNAVIKYGEAVGLARAQVIQEFDEYVAVLEFRKPVDQYTPRVDPSNERDGRIMLFACKFGQQAWEMENLRSSLFGYYLREAFAGKASDAAGAVTLFAAVKSASRHMEEQLAQVRREIEQVPIVMGTYSVDPVITSKKIRWNRSGQRRLAVLVGINRYGSLQLKALAFAERDAASMAQALRDNGGFETTTLLGPDATRHRIAAEIAERIRSPKKEDLFLFYFSGHGHSAGGQGYAFAYDSNPELSDSSLSLSDIDHLLDQNRATSSILIFDSNLMPY